MRGLGEDVDQLSRGRWIRIREAERPAVEPLLMRDVVHRAHDIVDRDDVDLPPLNPRHRHPLRDGVAKPPDQLEEVVGAVDLVHLAGLRVADDDARAVHPPRPRGLVPDHCLRVVLGAEVRMDVEVLGLLEHVLAPGPPVQTGGGDGADHVHATRFHCLRELHHVARALDVRDRLTLGVGGHVVDRGQVEQVVDVPLQPRDVFVGDPEPWRRQVPDDPDDAVLVGSPAVAELREPALGALADEHVDRALALEQQLDEIAADEAGRPRDEVAHQQHIWLTLRSRIILLS